MQVEFAWYMKKKGLADSTIRNRVFLLKRLTQLGADLTNPDTVETLLATTDLKPAYKRAYINAYKAYTLYINIKWDKPKTNVPQKEPFLPQESEVEQLIAGTGKATSTLIKLLHETGVRIGEASELKWTDINFKLKTVSINFPEKGSNSRTLKLSDTLIAMLNTLPKRKDNYIFNPKKRTLDSNFSRQRNRIAEQLQNPRLKQIHFHTLRHLKATTEYYKSGGDILKVKYILGHKHLDTTARYAHYQAFRNEEYTVRRPLTREEEDQLI